MTVQQLQDMTGSFKFITFFLIGCLGISYISNAVLIGFLVNVLAGMLILNADLFSGVNIFS